MMKIDEVKKFKKCHRIGHDLIFGIDSTGVIVKVCKKCKADLKTMRGFVTELEKEKELAN